ncbi:MAG: antibiotic biosynthesis monooxygenase [Pseudonocardiales bacterium]|jgi:quinol monooxygenase YgiN|nr:antibiotic biosynthesis monooxygenase [Pseudonocardiales bacterium]
MAVWEIAQLTVGQGKEDEFESLFRSNLQILKKADGCLDVKLSRAVDRKGTFLLLVKWQSVEHHTELFVQSDGFAKFTGLLAPLFSAPPDPFHVVEVIGEL